MAGYEEELRASVYVVQEYGEADRAYGEFRRSGDRKELRRAASVLCGLFRKLEEDQQFWNALRRAGQEGPEYLESMEHVLGLLREIQVEEEQAFVDLGLSPSQASRLVSDVLNAVELYEGGPSLESVQNLINRVADLRKEVCNVKALAKKDQIRTVERGLSAAAGAAAITADGVTAGLGPLAILASILAGGAALANAARK